MGLPAEIYRAIIREASHVPEAFDTSPSIIDESREVVVQLIHESMLTKTALSLVSKAFHDITDQFLYEIIMIFRFDYVPTIRKRLRSTSPSSCTPRGYRCRRLDFYLGTGAVDYPDTAWYEGGHTLWGLIPASPRLEILLCRIVFNDSSAPPTTMFNYPEHPHLTHNALWKTIASHCASSLRRLELYGFHIRMDRVEMMLRYFSKLEACCIVHVVAFDTEEGGCYDDEEPLFRRLAFGCRGIVLFDENRGAPSGRFDSEACAEFEEAKGNASTFEGTAPYLLPSLHSFSLHDFNGRITQFRLPALRHLGVYNVLVDSKQLLAETHAVFPSSVTHLNHAGDGVPLNDILRSFPHLIKLTLHMECVKFYPLSFSKPYPTLTTVKITLSRSRKDVGPYVHEMLSAIRSGMLSSLRTIEITRHEVDTTDNALPFEESKALGVALNVTTIELFALCGEYRWHD